MDGFYKKKLAGILKELTGEGAQRFSWCPTTLNSVRNSGIPAPMFFYGSVVTSKPAREFFRGNSFYTTAANRMARKWCPDVVTAKDVIETMSEAVKSRQKKGRQAVRKEAEDSRQARGNGYPGDGAGGWPRVASILSMLCFRWVSVPDLRYTPYSIRAGLWKLEEVAEGDCLNYGTPEAVTAAADQTAFLLRIGMAVSVVLGNPVYHPGLPAEGKGSGIWPFLLSLERIPDSRSLCLDHGYEHGAEHPGGAGKTCS